MLGGPTRTIKPIGSPTISKGDHDVKTIVPEKKPSTLTTMQMHRRQHVTEWISDCTQFHIESFTNEAIGDLETNGCDMRNPQGHAAPSRIVLRNFATDSIVAVCIRRSNRFHQDYFSIYKTFPVRLEQEPSKLYDHDGLHLYWWADGKQRFSAPEFIIETMGKNDQGESKVQPLLQTRGCGSDHITVHDVAMKRVARMQIQSPSGAKRRCEARIEISTNKIATSVPSSTAADATTLLICLFAILNEF